LKSTVPRESRSSRTGTISGYNIISAKWWLSFKYCQSLTRFTLDYQGDWRHVSSSIFEIEEEPEPTVHIVRIWLGQLYVKKPAIVRGFPATTTSTLLQRLKSPISPLTTAAQLIALGEAGDLDKAMDDSVKAGVDRTDEYMSAISNNSNYNNTDKSKLIFFIKFFLLNHINQIIFFYYKY